MMASKSFVFRFSEFEVRERELRLTRAGEPLPVEPKAFRVLVCLLRTPGKVVAKEELLRAVWGEIAVQDNSVTRAVALLRKVLDDDPRAPRYIETVSTVGNRFVCRVEIVEDLSGKPEAENQPVGGNGNEVVTPVPIPVVAPTPPIPEWRGRRRLWLTLGAAGVAAALAGAAWYVRRPLPPPRITQYVPITNDGRLKYLVGTDGSRLYLNPGDQSGPAEVAISGGQILPIPLDLPGGTVSSTGSWWDRPWVTGVSPDGSSLLVWDHFHDNENECWVVGVQGHSARYLTQAVEAAWSPDGKSGAYRQARRSLPDAERRGRAAAALHLYCPRRKICYTNRRL